LYYSTEKDIATRSQRIEGRLGKYIGIETIATRISISIDSIFGNQKRTLADLIEVF
jgi:hypothetical protein